MNVCLNVCVLVERETDILLLSGRLFLQDPKVPKESKAIFCCERDAANNKM